MGILLVDAKRQRQIFSRMDASELPKRIKIFCRPASKRDELKSAVEKIHAPSTQAKPKSSVTQLTQAAVDRNKSGMEVMVEDQKYSGKSNRVTSNDSKSDGIVDLTRKEDQADVEDGQGKRQEKSTKHQSKKEPKQLRILQKQPPGTVSVQRTIDLTKLSEEDEEDTKPRVTKSKPVHSSTIPMKDISKWVRKMTTASRELLDQATTCQLNGLDLLEENVNMENDETLRIMKRFSSP